MPLLKNRNYLNAEVERKACLQQGDLSKCERHPSSGSCAYKFNENWDPEGSRELVNTPCVEALCHERHWVDRRERQQSQSKPNLRLTSCVNLGEWVPGPVKNK